MIAKVASCARHDDLISHRAGTPPVAIVNQTFVNTYFPDDTDDIGRDVAADVDRFAERRSASERGYFSGVRFLVVRRRCGFALEAVAFEPTRSGSFFRPVSRFHSSKVSFEILPSTSSCANLRRCA
jgi:hypothetical protein